MRHRLVLYQLHSSSLRFSLVVLQVRSLFLLFISIIYPPLLVGGRIIVRVPVNDKVTREYDFPYDIPRFDFRDRIIAAMDLDRTTAQLGWKTSDEGKRAPAHQLATDFDIDNAFIPRRDMVITSFFSCSEIYQ